MEFKKMTLISAIALGMFACGGSESTTTPDETASEETTAGEATEAVEYVVDAENSKVAWRGEAIGSHFHTGLVSVKEGSISVAGDAVTAGSFTLDVSALSLTDENYTEEKGHTKADFIGHLASPDFLASEEFPEASFVVKSVKGMEVTGDFTVRGVTKEEVVTVSSITEGEGEVTVKAGLTFDRQKYNVSFGMKDIVIDDNVPLEITIVAKK